MNIDVAHRARDRVDDARIDEIFEDVFSVIVPVIIIKVNGLGTGFAERYCVAGH